MAETNFLSKFFGKNLDKIFGSLWGRLFIVVLQTVLSSLVLLFLFTLRKSGDITLLKYAIVLSIGLIAGFSARRFLKGHTRILKLLTALISAALSLVILYSLSGGFLGIDLLKPLNITPDWEGLILLVLAAFGAVLVLEGFRKSNWIKDFPNQTRISSPAARAGIKERTARPSQIATKTGKKRIQKSTRVNSGKKAPLSITKTRKGPAPLAIASAKTKSPTKKLAKLPKKASAAKKIKKPVKAKTKRSRKIAKNDIKFTGVEEHVCPYCLDPVEPHDPRGVKICPICKTHHHKDCWGITGACQIPHLNNKS